MCSTNDCCDENFNGRIFIDESDNPTPNPESSTPDIDIVGKAPIRVKSFMRGTTKVYEISLHIPAPPNVSMSVSPSFVEFNKPFVATYTVGYSKGSEDIVSRTLSPSPTPLPDIATSPFTFMVSDTATQLGTRYVHTFKIVDTENQQAEASKGLEVYYRYYKGLVARNGTLNAAQVNTFTSAIGPSIQSVFGTKTAYVNASGSDAHFCWLRPLDSPEMGTPVGDGNFPFETKVEPYTVTLNGVQYAVIKTVNFFPTSTNVDLSF